MKKPKNFWTGANRPFVLKRRLLEFDIAQSELARRITNPNTKRPMTTNYLCGALRKGKPPPGWEEEFKRRAEIALAELGVPTDGIWGQEEEVETPVFGQDQARGRRSRYQTNNQGEGVPVNVPREILSRKELGHFGLTEDPFGEVENFSDIWTHGGLEAVKAQIKETVHRHRLMALVGEVGAGKSVLLRHAMSELLNEPRVKLIFPNCMNRKELDGDGLIAEILRGLGEERVPNARVARNHRVRALLEASVTQGEQVALVIDEAHDLPPRVFISLKRLWDSAMLFKLLGVVISGQGGIRPGGAPWGLQALILGNPDLREFAERCHLVAMPRLRNGQLNDYLNWRFERVGGNLENVFEDGAVLALAHRTTCLQLANNLAIRALKTAVVNGLPRVTAEMVAGV